MFKSKQRKLSAAAHSGAAALFLSVGFLAPARADWTPEDKPSGNAAAVQARAAALNDAEEARSEPRLGDDADAEREAEAKRQREERRKQMAEEDARRAAEREAYEKTFAAVHAQGAVIEAAMHDEDGGALEGLFNWDLFAKYTSEMTAKDPTAYRKSKDAALLYEGEWERDKDGVFTGIYVGSTPRESESLKARVMYYITEFYFGAPGLAYASKLTEAHEGYRITIDGTDYVGKPIYISLPGQKEKEFWVAATKGSEEVRILNFRDKASFATLQSYEARRDPRRPAREAFPAGDKSRAELDAELPEAAHTEAKPKAEFTVACIEHAKQGLRLNQARLSVVRSESDPKEKKAALGALLDLLIDAAKEEDRAKQHNLTVALFDVWGALVPIGWSQEDMQCTVEGENDTDTIVRRWIAVYNAYKTD
jgi:hypothetical protein